MSKEKNSYDHYITNDWKIKSVNLATDIKFLLSENNINKKDFFKKIKVSNDIGEKILKGEYNLDLKRIYDIETFFNNIM